MTSQDSRYVNYLAMGDWLPYRWLFENRLIA